MMVPIAKVRFGSAEQFGQFPAEQFGSAELKVKKFGSVRPNLDFGPPSSVRFGSARKFAVRFTTNQKLQ